MDPLLLLVCVFSSPPLTFLWPLLLLIIFILRFLVFRGVTPFTNDEENIPCIATPKSGDMAVVPSSSSFLILLISLFHWFLFVFPFSFLLSPFLRSFSLISSLFLFSPGSFPFFCQYVVIIRQICRGSFSLVSTPSFESTDSFRSILNYYHQGL